MNRPQPVEQEVLNGRVIKQQRLVTVSIQFFEPNQGDVGLSSKASFKGVPERRAACRSAGPERDLEQGVSGPRSKGGVNRQRPRAHTP